ncbi:MAG TPA: SAM-dependent chlorinase/fluorinase, partial [Acidimicrobiales bacterium]|nr:SAM-dependent chlorinase/fluorinase [Acidimicrobiales bacterium]
MPAVFFLSDYGLVDEFVGVVHAVLQRLAPGVPVVDLTHQVPSFDVAAAARVLERAAPHLGAGVVLAVVDPGVGSERRGVAIEVGSEVGPRWMVGPDNGLLLPAARLLGGPRRALSLGRASTFDGRDVFAPAAAHLVAAGAPEDLGAPIAVDSLVGLAQDASEASVSVSAGVLSTSVIWVDRFGNVQLAGGRSSWEQAGVVLGSRATIELGASPGDGPGGEQSVPPSGHHVRARRVSAY